MPDPTLDELIDVMVERHKTLELADLLFDEAQRASVIARRAYEDAEKAVRASLERRIRSLGIN